MQGIITTAIDGQKTNGAHKVSVLSLEDYFGVTPPLGVSWLALSKGILHNEIFKQQADDVL